jgi:hypothetical protein
MSQDYEEKRSFTRMRVETTVRFSVNRNSDITYEGLSRDLSATGLLMQADYAPPLGAELHLEMHTDNERLPPFVADGEVLRVEVDPAESGKYLISVALNSTQ